MTDPVGLNSLSGLLKHGYRWLINLRRAKMDRKKQSIDALRKVVSSCRETAVYLRQVQAGGGSDHQVEKHLSILWTELGFALTDLGLDALAKKCQISGKHWSDPDYFDQEFLTKADISLERMEKLALVLIYEIEGR